MILLYDFTWVLFLVAVIAFLCEYMDSSLGMGYGTTLTPILLIMGFEPIQIVPAVLLSEFITGIISALFHVLFKNMTLGFKESPRTDIDPIVDQESAPLEPPKPTSSLQSKKGSAFFAKFMKLTTDSKVVIILIGFGALGTILSSVLSAYFSYGSLFKFAVKLYIGVMVLSMGVLILVYIRRQMHFSLKKIILIGALAGFNKGISGGGYGPLAVSGQILSGRDGKNAIASTSLSEGVICFVGVVATLITNLISSHASGGPFDIGDWGLSLYLIIGAVLSTPLAALTTKKVESKWLKIVVAIVTILLGSFTLIKTILNFTGYW